MSGAARWVEVEGGGFVNLDRITTLKPVESEAPDRGWWLLEARGWSFCERLTEQFTTKAQAIARAGVLVGEW